MALLSPLVATAILALFRTAIWWKGAPAPQSPAPQSPAPEPTMQDAHDAAWVIRGTTKHPAYDSPAWVFENPGTWGTPLENRLRSHFFNDTVVSPQEALYADFAVSLPANAVIRHLLDPEVVIRLHNFGNQTCVNFLGSTPLHKKPAVHQKQAIMFVNRWAGRPRRVSWLHTEFWFPYITRSYLDGMQGFTFAVRPTGPRLSRVFVIYSYRPFRRGPLARLCSRVLFWWTMMDFRSHLSAGPTPPAAAPHGLLALRYDEVAEFMGRLPPAPAQAAEATV